MNNNNTAPRIKKESKNKIKVDFDRSPLKDRLKAKYLNGFFYKKLLISLGRFLLLLGLSYIILFPFFSKVSASFMSPRDFLQTDVKYIPKFPTVDQYKYLITENNYIKALINTFLLSGACALIQTFICAFIGYGFAKFKFKGNGVMFIIVLVTMMLPHQFMQASMYLKFRYFVLDSTGIYSALGLTKGLIDTFVPLIILSLTGLAFKNGLFIFIMRQFYRGVPDELEESSYVDGYGVFKTFFYIILPLSVPMLVTATGSTMLVSDPHFSKASSPMVVRATGSSIPCRAVHSWNALVPIFLTDVGRTMRRRVLHFRNVLLSIS